MNSLTDIKKLTNDVKLLYFDSDEKIKTSTLVMLRELLKEIAPQDDIEPFAREKYKMVEEYVFMTASDLGGRIIDISQAYLDFTCYTRKEVIGKSHKIFRNYDIDKTIIKSLWETILEDKVWKGELKNHKKTGEEYWINTIIKPMYDTNGLKIGYISIKENITAQKRLEELSRKDPHTLLYNKVQFEHSLKRDLIKSTSQHHPIALIVLKIDEYLEYKNSYGESESYKLLQEISTLLKSEFHTDIAEIFKLSDSEFAMIILNQSNQYIENIANKLLKLTRELRAKTSTNLSISLGLVNLETHKYYVNSNELYTIASMNAAKAKELGGNTLVFDLNEEYIKNIKDIDSITKLPNRVSLVNDLTLLEEEAMLIILHINQLNALKELYGFEFASEFLFKKAQELKTVLNPNEATLYNLNLHEFAILVTKRTMFEKYFSILKHSILMTDDTEEYSSSNYIDSNFTAGISYGIQNIFNHADVVLQEALISKITHKTYKNNQSAKLLQEENINRLQVYKRALHTGKIIPYFQPIIDAKDGTVIKYEALARIETDNGEIISPYYFLDSAHEDKTFEYFTRQMMQKVFHIFSKNDISISINLNYQNINSPTMVEYIQNRLEKYGGNGITFEILETEDILEYKTMQTFIEMVKMYGCKVSIDDFGSGYSNFTNIIKLDIDYLKFDGSLIEKLNSDENVKHMVKGLVTYAKNTNIKTIAEFVSTRELADTVREIGVDYIQGYFYGEPQAPEFYGLK